MNSVQYLFGEQFPLAVAKSLRRQGIDILTAREAGLQGKPDRDYLVLANETRRVVVTQDRDFLRLHADTAAHRGIVCCAQGSRSIGQTVEGLLLIQALFGPDEIAGRVESL